MYPGCYGKLPANRAFGGPHGPILVDSDICIWIVPSPLIEDALLAELVIRDVEDIVRHAPVRDAIASPDVFHSDRGSTG
ncbi:hypothetical protein HETIRDRAFT_451999 [Heterobasidion irregulare TC 32-1]|uniref:Uncharacterized protein n=1 Tax=Heterobasidion irregulare (strain TC 32-1) TaxID=747525 RepID=W4K3K4_HETIT|nr:uncharacterized protein HETIRDRAFT_451999 [Heterobasidion irregulare TC 32-1]ETW80392.1 hypothetical protein HETIRDRAFT_451999 [Heterobasidion irregulare TC 32-1]